MIMKNPNGYGSVYKLSGNRRRPFIARKTIGFNEKGHPIYFTVGYYAKRSEAMRALAEFNGRNADMSEGDITLSGLFEKWKREKWESLSAINQAKIRSAYRWIRHLEDKKYRLLKVQDMQKCIDACPNKTMSKRDILLIFRRLNEVADRNGIIAKRMSQFLEVEVIPPKEKSVFTDEQIRKIIECSDPFAETVLMYLFTGLRKTELLTMKTKDVHPAERYMRGGIKTKAGKNRIIPIHKIIASIVDKRMKTAGALFLGMSDKEFNSEWKRFMKLLEMNHTPHETRHTFRSLLDSAGGNQKCINLIMGHSSGEGIGEKVYTHKTIKELIDTVDLVRF